MCDRQNANLIWPLAIDNSIRKSANQPTASVQTDQSGGLGMIKDGPYRAFHLEQKPVRQVHTDPSVELSRFIQLAIGAWMERQSNVHLIRACAFRKTSSAGMP